MTYRPKDMGSPITPNRTFWGAIAVAAHFLIYIMAFVMILL